MKNILFDLNIIFDFYNTIRRKRFPESIEAYQYIQVSEDYQAYISSSSLDNLEFIKKNELYRERLELSPQQINSTVQHFIKELLITIKLAKTPSYIDIDYKDIEDSQIMGSVKAINGMLLTRDKELIKKYPDLALSVSDFLTQIKQDKHRIDFVSLKKQYIDLQPKIEQQIDDVLNTTSFIMGSKINELETQLQDFTSVK